MSAAPLIDVDVLVVGLGPAGASAAAQAARAGARVMAIERNAQPGLPVQCAEFVPMMLGSHAPEIAVAAVSPIDHMLTAVEDEAPDLTPDFHGHMIDRARFDALLVAQSRAAGADCRHAVPLRSVDASGTAVLADGTAVRARVVIGADGPRSLVGKAIGSINRDLVETRQVTVDLLAPHGATDIFLAAGIVGGYGWLFPKGRTCNLGVGVCSASKRQLKPLLDDLHACLAAHGRVGKSVHAHTGGAIPVGGIVGLQGKLGDTQVLLAGDAAGLTNPVTGAGINAAVISGRLAGEAAAAIVAGDAAAADDYCDEIEALFGRSLALARRRRRQLWQARQSGPTPAQLRDGWIAYPQYWNQDGDEKAGANGRDEARMTA